MSETREIKLTQNVFDDFPEFAAKYEFIPMRELIYKYMRDAIISDRLEAGMHLVEEDLAKKLNASRTPVREALRKLELEGLVKHHRRRGVEVRQFTVHDASALYDLGAILEGYAAKLMSRKHDSEEVAVLGSLLEDMRRSIDQGDRDLEMELHRKWHLTIYEACGNKKVEQLLLEYTDYLQLFRAYAIQVPGRWRETLEEHEKIYSAIACGDADLAEKYAREHLELGKDAFITIWQQKKAERCYR